MVANLLLASTHQHSHLSRQTANEASKLSAMLTFRACEIRTVYPHQPGAPPLWGGSGWRGPGRRAYKRSNSQVLTQQ